MLVNQLEVTFALPGTPSIFSRSSTVFISNSVVKGIIGFSLLSLQSGNLELRNMTMAFSKKRVSIAIRGTYRYIFFEFGQFGPHRANHHFLFSQQPPRTGIATDKCDWSGSEQREGVRSEGEKSCSGGVQN